jgi:hypothetical protein
MKLAETNNKSQNNKNYVNNSGRSFTSIAICYDVMDSISDRTKHYHEYDVPNPIFSILAYDLVNLII